MLTNASSNPELRSRPTRVEDVRLIIELVGFTGLWLFGVEAGKMRGTAVAGSDLGLASMLIRTRLSPRSPNG
jgi:tetrahydromethanopterin S-methyltransferase subunit F